MNPLIQFIGGDCIVGKSIMFCHFDRSVAEWRNLNKKQL